ncbi:MAG: nicotinate-nucleotide adenylyltransferase [Lachnospiraceae bacterium]|nr:nicotinate-nucleotide adenylyltransferase [Candidatus Fimimorpha excrementavium]
MKRKIGIMGGTFDPIHNGHLALGEEAYRQFSLDEVVFMPTGIPPHKAGKKIADAGDRNYMVEAAVAATPYFSCSDMELRRHRTTYTAETLTQLRAENPETEYYYIVGADSLEQMDGWYHPEIIFQNAVILAAMRQTQTAEEFSNAKEMLENKYGASIYLLKGPIMPVSSSQIRAYIRDGVSAEAYLPRPVWEYIKEKKLYCCP